MVMRRKLIGRKLLVASAGLATVSYVGCKSVMTTSGNLMPPLDAAADVYVPPPTIGNLMPPPPVDAALDAALDGAGVDGARDGEDAGEDASGDRPPDVPPTTGNLMPPPRLDGGADGKDR
jgi:hypothetical protein